MPNFYFTILLLFCFTNVFCQTGGNWQILKGKITSASNQVMFATVGIAKENIGTITDDNGEFELKIPYEQLDQILIVSHIGYQTLQLRLDSLLKLDDVLIELTEQVELLDEVVVTSEKLIGKTKELGNTKKHKLFLWIQNGDRGSEIVTLINPKGEMLLNSVSLNIFNQLEKEFTLLLNIYKVDATTNLPSDQVLKNQKIIRSNLLRGWLDVDLTAENIVLNEPFYVGFQWVKIDEPSPMIGGKHGSIKNSLIRYKALGTWEKYAQWDIKAKGTVYTVE